MSWATDNLRPASFRGFAFFVDTAETTGGAATVTHTFPLRNDVAHEWLGIVPRAFAIEMILIGDDVLTQAQQMEDALSQQSSGRLIHPWYGEQTVAVVGGYRTRWATNENRVARISVQFELAGGALSPTSKADTTAAVNRAADSAKASAISDFARNFTTKGMLDFVSQHALASVQAIGRATTSLLQARGLSNLISSGGIAGTAGALAGLGVPGLQDTATLANQVAGLYTLSDDATPSLQLSNALNSVGSGHGLVGAVQPINGSTPSWKRAAANQQHLQNLARVSAAIEGARIGSAAGWESRQQAMSWRDQVASNLDAAADLAGDNGWENSWAAATDLRATVIKDVTTRAAPLPQLATLTPRMTQPTALIAYQINGDDLSTLFDRADDIRHRNGIRHPGFVPGGAPIEVLTDG